MVERRKQKLRRSSDEHWLKHHWRPMMAWQYFAVCIFDFIIAPTFVGIFAALTKTPLIIWQPLTLQGGGLYHIAMGAIIGITSYGRTQEKLGTQTQPLPVTTPETTTDPEK